MKSKVTCYLENAQKMASLAGGYRLKAYSFFNTAILSKFPIERIRAVSGVILN